MNLSQIAEVVTAILNAHGLFPVDMKLETGYVYFEVWSVKGQENCWATASALTVGGRGEMAGSVTDALKALCFSLR